MLKAGLIHDDSPHYLDHLGPLCASLNWPLLVCEPSIAELANRFYPDLKVIEIPFWELKLPPLIIACEPQILLQATFPNQKIDSFWLPHGNSDKGWDTPFFEALQSEKTALVYGAKMVDFLSQKNVFPDCVSIGNFRWEYFLNHTSFYQLSLPKGKNFLYAPTWDDSAGSCSFWKAFPQLAARLPEDCNLLVKLHPNTLRKYEAHIEVLIGRYQKQKNILFLPNHPPIYPLLAQCDAYIGDMSSIGYDFLTFDKPLFFLNANPNFPLHQCGTAICAETFDFSLKDTLNQKRQELYRYTFTQNSHWKEQIHARSGS
jgi:hypothetical protein